MSAQVEICNMALSHLAVGKEIASITENTEEARVLNRFYEPARKKVLRDGSWPFATRFVALGLVESAPTSEWDYSYRYPTDCLKVRRIFSGTRNDTRQTRVPYKLAGDSQGTLILTDMDDAEIEYTVNADNPQFYAPDFELAFSYYLAFLSASRLTRGDKYKLGAQAFQLYQLEIKKSIGNAANEEQEEEIPDSEFIRERE